MIKKAILSFLLIGNLIHIGFAQDSTTYQLQRNKINSMLAERSNRFGKYEESLNARTGIFGFQTKRDIKNSNEILRQVVLHDNNIFTELKVLLDYKDLQFQQAKSNIDHSQMRIDSYKKTIRDLQMKNEELLAYNQKADKNTDFLQLLLVLFVISTTACGVIIYRKNKVIKTKQPKSEIKVL